MWDRSAMRRGLQLHLGWVGMAITCVKDAMLMLREGALNADRL